MSALYLFERWHSVAQQFSSEPAILDHVTGKTWTFRDLLDASESASAVSAPVAFPQGHSVEFILTLLKAWRLNVVTCPLEQNQTSPQIASNLPEGCAHIKISSATSGAPKFIVFTGRQLEADARNIVSTMRLERGCPNIGAISLAHSYGFSNLVLPLLLHGIPLVLVSAPLPQLILDAARRFDSVTVPAVPALWKTWFETGSIPPSVRIAISAGAPLPLDLERGIFEKHGLKVHNFYGSSECGGIAYDRSEMPRESGACVGGALDNVRLSISERQTLVIESEAVGQTYWPEPLATLGGGRFETTDLAEVRDGKIFLVGRATDVVNVAGRKFSPETIEVVLRTHPAVAECVVFGVPGSAGEAQQRTELLVAAVNLRTAAGIQELASFLSSRVPAWQIPRQWWFTEELAPNTRGKISRAEWKRRFLESQVS